MCKSILLHLLLPILFINVTTGLPYYIHVCDIDDPQLNDCIKDRANMALPHFLKYGPKDFNTPQLLPFIRKHYTFHPRQDFLLELTNLNIIGFERLEVTDINFDRETKQFDITFQSPETTWIADYKMEGIVFDRPIKGNGKLNLTLVDGTYNVFSHIKTVELNNQIHYELYNLDADFENKVILYQFDGLYGGDEKRSNEMSKMINDDWKTFTEGLVPGTNKLISENTQTVMNAIFKTYPAADFFSHKKYDISGFQ